MDLENRKKPTEKELDASGYGLSIEVLNQLAARFFCVFIDDIRNL